MTEATEATERFSGLAASYSAGRPSYPPEAIDFILQKCGLSSQSKLADIGCGTGISSRLFAGKNIDVIGIEPNDDMLQQAKCEANPATGKPPQYRQGDAQNTGLESHSVDVVLAAQAFHWFQSDAAIAEFCRILKPDGWIALMWNERDQKDSFTNDYGELLRSFPETAKVEMHRHQAGDALLISKQIKNGSLTWFKNEQEMDWQGLVQRAASTSYAPKQSPERDILLEGLQRLFAQYGSGGTVVMRYETSIYLAQRS